jgi:uncharacterized protein
MGYLNRVSIAVMLAMLIMAFDRELLGMVPGAKALNDIRYAVAITLNLLDVIITVLLVLVVGGVGLARQWHVIGLRAPDRASLIWGAVILIPPLIILAITTPLTREETPTALFLTGIAFPMAEEIFFRGLATGILMLVAGWRFLPAAIIPSLFFGLGHAYLGADFAEAAQLTAITGVGGVFFGWLYWKWDDNLWPPFFIHAGLNLFWGLFDLGNNAIGGWLGNALRVAMIAAAIILTIKRHDWLGRLGGEGQPA